MPPCSQHLPTPMFEVLTPGHFLFGTALESVPDPDEPLLRCWSLCQHLKRHLWKRWSSEYVDQLHKFSKWNIASRNVQVGDVVCVRGKQSAPTKWPLAVGEKVHPGNDGKVWVVTIRTSKGTYTPPVTKIVPLINDDSKSLSAGGGVFIPPGGAEDV